MNSKSILVVATKRVEGVLSTPYFQMRSNFRKKYKLYNSITTIIDDDLATFEVLGSSLMQGRG